MSIDVLPYDDRVNYGKGKEEDIRRCLNESYGFNLKPSTLTEDCEEKTDCWKVDGEKKLRCAIKIRDNSQPAKEDILACLWEPFHGVKDPRTKMGRDMLYIYYWYVTLSPDEKVIRVADGAVCHQIFSDMWNEWLAKVGDMCDFLKDKSMYKHKIVNSVKHPGCELWMHRDSKNGRWKILGFIPPSYLKENEIDYYPFLLKDETDGKRQCTAQ